MNDCPLILANWRKKHPAIDKASSSSSGLDTKEVEEEEEDDDDDDDNDDDDDDDDSGEFNPDDNSAGEQEADSENRSKKKGGKKVEKVEKVENSSVERTISDITLVPLEIPSVGQSKQVGKEPTVLLPLENEPHEQNVVSLREDPLPISQEISEVWV